MIIVLMDQLLKPDPQPQPQHTFIAHQWNIRIVVTVVMGSLWLIASTPVRSTRYFSLVES